MAELADAVVRAAGDAAAYARSRWRTDVRRWEKAPGNPVCEVDLDVDAMLRDRLTALLPEAGWLSEETADNPDRLARRHVWVVDPIDGTRDYLRGRDGWAVSVALIEDGRPVLGVLDAPARGELWRATAGGGATRNGVPLRCGDRASLAGARVPADALPRADRDLVAVAKPNSIALRIAMVAADQADLAAGTRRSGEWDIAAAVLIAREAGCTVSDAAGRELVFNTRDGRADGVLASVPAIHAAALARLAARSG